MKINNQYSVNNKQIAFNGIYAIRGNVEDIDIAKKMICEDIKNPFKYGFNMLDQQGDVFTLGVATKNDVKKVKTSSFKYLAQEKIIDAKELINPFITTEFDAIHGVFTQVKTFCQNGKTLIYSIFSHPRYAGEGKLEAVRFDKPRSIAEALEELAKIQDGTDANGVSITYLKRDLPSMANCAEDIEKCEELKDIKISGLCGLGRYSVALETSDKKCLKFSFVPNAPLKDKIYDIPTLKKGKIALKNTNDKLYYAIQERGLNSSEYRISDKHLKKVKRMIYLTNPSSRITDFSETQIVIFNDRPYLVDAPVVMNRPLYK